MTPPLSKELQKQIEREAEAYATKEWNTYPSNAKNQNTKIHWQNSKEDYIAGATTYAALLQDSERRRNEANALLFPLLDYGQSKEANIPLGASITAVILQRAKQFEEARKALEDISNLFASRNPGDAAYGTLIRLLRDAHGMALTALASWKEEGKDDNVS